MPRRAMFMGLLILILLLTGTATVVALGVAAAQRRRELVGQTPKALPAGASGGAGDALLMRTIRELRPGDVLGYEGRDYLVEGVVAYEEDGHRWNAGRLVDGEDERWMMVGLERGGSLTVRMLAVDPEVEVSGYPPEVVVVGGMRFTLDRRGTATATVSGDTGLAVSGQAEGGAAERCRWWLYASVGEDTLVIEQWSNVYRALRGTKISAALVDLLPGS